MLWQILDQTHLSDDLVVELLPKSSPITHYSFKGNPLQIFPKVKCSSYITQKANTHTHTQTGDEKLKGGDFSPLWLAVCRSIAIATTACWRMPRQSKLEAEESLPFSWCVKVGQQRDTDFCFSRSLSFSLSLPLSQLLLRANNVCCFITNCSSLLLTCDLSVCEGFGDMKMSESRQTNDSVWCGLSVVKLYDDQPKSKSNKHDNIWQDRFKHGTA